MLAFFGPELRPVAVARQRGGNADHAVAGRVAVGVGNRLVVRAEPDQLRQPVDAARQAKAMVGLHPRIELLARLDARLVVQPRLGGPVQGDFHFPALRLLGGSGDVELDHLPLRRVARRVGLGEGVERVLPGVVRFLAGRALVLRRLGLALGQRRHVPGHGQRNQGCRHQHHRQHRAQDGNRRVVARPADVAFEERLPAGLDRLVVYEALQIVAQRPGRLVAVQRVAVNRLMYDRHQVARHLAVEPVQPRRLGGSHLLDQAIALLFRERRTQGRQLIERQPQRVDVAAAIGLGVERLRRHVN